MTTQEKEIIEEVLDTLIYNIRSEGNQGIPMLVFAHHRKDFFDKTPTPKNLNDVKNFEWTKRQIRSKVLTSDENPKYFRLNDQKAKFVETFAINNEKEFDKFEDYINSLWGYNLEERMKSQEKKNQEIKESKEKIYKDILKEKYTLYKDVVGFILEDKLNYPYKSDKIKIFLEMGLDVETIFLLMNTQEKLMAPRGYIEKYLKEREEEIKAKKIVVYEINSVIDDVRKKIRN